tara:strand:- start:47497 stop:48354 length:858 start_codon:yes stop_codon:yes gene_type:complete
MSCVGFIVPGWFVFGTEAVDLTVSHHARSIQPGEVVVIEVRSANEPVSIYAVAFGRGVRFYWSEMDETWRGLIGIDLETAPGKYQVEIRATIDNGEIIQEVYTLQVEKKDFPTRHLKVNPNFVNPPEEVIERITREAKTIADIFAKSSHVRHWSGEFRAPVPGNSTSGFGRRSVYNGEPRSPHSGTDFRAGSGTSVKAPNIARVVLTGELYFSGNVVILDHGWGLYSYFAHLSSIDVIEGEMVATGQVVGKVGATGRVTGPHLHWTARLNGARVDPISLMTLLEN